MSKSRPRPEDIPVQPSKKRRIKLVMRQQWLEREMQFFPQPDPPIYKPLG